MSHDLRQLPAAFAMHLAASFLHLLSLYFFFSYPLSLSPFVYVRYLRLFWSVSLIMWSKLSGDTQANNTPGEETRGVVCENSLGVIPTAIYINNCTTEITNTP